MKIVTEIFADTVCAFIYGAFLFIEAFTLRLPAILISKLFGSSLFMGSISTGSEVMNRPRFNPAFANDSGIHPDWGDDGPESSDEINRD